MRSKYMSKYEYQCLDCGREFATADEMNDHIDAEHNEGYGEQGAST